MKVRQLLEQNNEPLLVQLLAKLLLKSVSVKVFFDRQKGVPYKDGVIIFLTDGEKPTFSSGNKSVTALFELEKIERGKGNIKGTDMDGTFLIDYRGSWVWITDDYADSEVSIVTINKDLYVITDDAEKAKSFFKDRASS